MPIRRRAPVLARLALPGALALAACASGGLSDEQYQWCTNTAPAAELDAAAEALNISPDADRSFETNPNRGDPTFQRICEYAWNARGRDMGQPANQPEPSSSVSAPLDPQRSEDAGSPGAATPMPSGS